MPVRTPARIVTTTCACRRNCTKARPSVPLQGPSPCSGDNADRELAPAVPAVPCLRIAGRAPCVRNHQNRRREVSLLRQWLKRKDEG